MTDKRSLLIGLRVTEVVGSAICLGLHIKSYRLPNEPSQHITVFCGTYMGFIMVSTGFLLALCYEYRAPRLLHVVFGGLATLLFFTCGLIVMYFVQTDEHLVNMTEAEENAHLFVVLSRAKAIASFLVGLVYAFDMVLSAAIWQEDLGGSLVSILRHKDWRPSGHRRIVFIPEDEMQEIEVHCYCLRCTRWSCACTPQEEDTPPVPWFVTEVQSTPSVSANEDLSSSGSLEQHPPPSTGMLKPAGSVRIV